MRRRWIIGVTLLVVPGIVVAVGLARWAPSAADGLLKQAETAYRHGEWNQAADSARQFLRLQPTDSTVLRLLARASARSGRDDVAESLYRRLGTQRMQAEDLFLLGQSLLRRDLRGPGLTSLGAARDLDPNHPETLNALFEFVVEAQAMDQAQDDAERLRRQPGWTLRGLFLLARVRHALLDPDEAATLSRQALERDFQGDPGKTDPRAVRVLLARCLLETGQGAEAQALLEKILSAGPDSEASWLLSRALLMEGKSAQALAAREQAEDDWLENPLLPQPAPFVGAARCASCHPREYLSQQHSRHARTILHGPELPAIPWPDHPLTDLNNPDVTHTTTPRAGQVEVAARIESEVFSAVVEYAMGSNRHGRSFVGHDREGQARELRLSQYPEAPVWSRTSEHPDVPPDHAGYLGRPIADESLRRCVHCHATNYRIVQFPDGRAEAGDHGIGCERCHGPAGLHLRAVDEKFDDLAIARPRLADAAAVVGLCGECHKAPNSASPDSPSFIRFQAPTFMQSRCFTESGTLSCVTCHNPHRDVDPDRDRAGSEKTCKACHPAPTSQQFETHDAKDERKVWAPCPTHAREGCLDCHMPRLKDAVPRAEFTDHHIRVRSRPGKA